MPPYQEWVTLEYWDAPDANFLGSQLVYRFDDIGDRASQLGDPEQGMLCYLASTALYEYYNGSSWIPLLPSGTAVLVAGTVTVANTSVTATSRIFLTSQIDGGTVGWLRVSARTAATSFVITSSSATDTSTVAWLMLT